MGVFRIFSRIDESRCGVFDIFITFTRWCVSRSQALHTRALYRPAVLRSAACQMLSRHVIREVYLRERFWREDALYGNAHRRRVVFFWAAFVTAPDGGSLHYWFNWIRCHYFAIAEVWRLTSIFSSMPWLIPPLIWYIFTRVSFEFTWDII